MGPSTRCAAVSASWASAGMWMLLCCITEHTCVYWATSHGVQWNYTTLPEGLLKLDRINNLIMGLLHDVQWNHATFPIWVSFPKFGRRFYPEQLIFILFIKLSSLTNNGSLMVLESKLTTLHSVVLLPDHWASSLSHAPGTERLNSTTNRDQQFLITVKLISKGS